VCEKIISLSITKMQSKLQGNTLNTHEEALKEKQHRGKTKKR
jgi:hypothetical protein